MSIVKEESNLPILAADSDLERLEQMRGAVVAQAPSATPNSRPTLRSILEPGDEGS